MLPMPLEEKPKRKVWLLGLIRTYYAEDCQTVGGFQNTYRTFSTLWRAKPKLFVYGLPKFAILLEFS